MVQSWMGGNEILHEDQTLRVATRKNLGISVWTGAPEVGQIRAMYRITERLTKAWPDGAALLSVIVRGTPSFSEQMRGELVKSLKTNRPLVGSAHLILAQGFAGTATRAFMSTVILLARPPTPNRVFGAEDEALAWLQDQLRSTKAQWAPGELRTALQAALKDR